MFLFELVDSLLYPAVWFFPLSCTAEAPAAGILVRVEPQGQAYNRFVLRGGTTTVCCMSSH